MEIPDEPLVRALLWVGIGAAVLLGLVALEYILGILMLIVGAVVYGLIEAWKKLFGPKRPKVERDGTRSWRYKP